MSTFFDAKQYVQFQSKMEWEGGIGGLLEYGWTDPTGSSVLDDLWDDLNKAYQLFQEEMALTEENNKAEIQAVYDEEYEDE